LPWRGATAAQVPVPTAGLAPYIGVRTIPNALPGNPPPFAYVGRRRHPR
jgi:hypothetical protein